MFNLYLTNRKLSCCCDSRSYWIQRTVY